MVAPAQLLADRDARRHAVAPRQRRRQLLVDALSDVVAGVDLGAERQQQGVERKPGQRDGEPLGGPRRPDGDELAGDDGIAGPDETQVGVWRDDGRHDEHGDEDVRAGGGEADADDAQLRGAVQPQPEHERPRDVQDVREPVDVHRRSRVAGPLQRPATDDGDVARRRGREHDGEVGPAERGDVGCGPQQRDERPAGQHAREDERDPEDESE